MELSAVHRYELKVPESAIDANRHVNNVEYVRWMQEAAVAHSDAVGCTAATQAAGATWVVRTHRIEYRRPALTGDHLEVRTWIADYRKVVSLRKYEFHRLGDGTLLAQGETDWVFVDLVTGRPKRIPPEIERLFEIGRT
jgi:acyl-CoA thioester hydrolase